ncbi:SCO family protein [Variovorax sp. YR216]|uniref:SCO family protein n=1 Tax=Variovorax sp. YR216 TaxID=1882828 RepID=UPI00089C08E8|nr:SCO family protein [Variovorax sp. YR216]SEB25947.1 protein SCO1/2 [Variovorax sp. YR216]
MTIFRTVFASVMIIATTCVAAHGLTHGFRAWTAEDVRRLEIATHPVPTPAVQVEGPGVAGVSLHTLLAHETTPTIVDFAYTRCQIACAALGSVFQQLQRAILDDDTAGSRVHLLTISFDPAYDDAEVLGRYAVALHAEPRVWRFVRASPGDATQELLDRFRVTVIDDGLGGWEHNAALLVIDGSGRLVRVFDYSETERALRFARSLSSPESATP